MTALDAGSTVSQASTQDWKDSKRYLWLLGLVVPSLAFVAWGLHALTGWGVWWWIGPIVVFGVVPAGRPGGRARPEQPAGRRDRGAGERPVLPVDHLPLPADPVRRPGLGLLDVHQRRTAARGPGRPRAEHRDDRGHRHQHRPRARPQEGAARALAGQDRAGAELLRALLHRAQPRPPRPRRHPGGPGQLTRRRVAVRVPAAHRPRLAAQRVEPGEAAVRAARAGRTGRSATTWSTPGSCRWCSGVR